MHLRTAGQPVQVRSFTDVHEVGAYDGIWCCASLLHVPLAELPQVLQRLWRALRAGGRIYVSFKLGKGERSGGGRKFTDADEDDIRAWVGQLPDLQGIEVWTTDDQRPGCSQKWINAIAKRFSSKLVTGETDHFLPHLSAAITQALRKSTWPSPSSRRRDYGCCYLTCEAWRLAPESNRRVRVLTSDYLDITDPEALRLLLLLQERGAEVRVYSTQEGSFHLKAYIFARQDEQLLAEGTAFIGSSNISRQALQEGWNGTIGSSTQATPAFSKRDSGSKSCSGTRTRRAVRRLDRGLRAARCRRRARSRRAARKGGAARADAGPARALAALAATREAGFRRGLVVLATGLGKTWLAAFDAVRMGARRVLFVAHREEILSQAAATFLRIRPQARRVSTRAAPATPKSTFSAPRCRRWGRCASGAVCAAALRLRRGRRIPPRGCRHLSAAARRTSRPRSCWA